MFCLRPIKREQRGVAEAGRTEGEERKAVRKEGKPLRSSFPPSSQNNPSTALTSLQSSHRPRQLSSVKDSWDSGDAQHPQLGEWGKGEIQRQLCGKFGSLGWVETGERLWEAI